METVAKIHINIPGLPVPKARARMNFRGQVYTPKKTRAFEDTVRLEAALAMQGKAPLSGPLAVRILVFLQRPKTSKRPYPDVRPDLDNFVKAALDGCNGVVFGDDAQICSLEAVKFYDEQPGMVIDAMPWKPILCEVRAA